ncbi:MAG TPA: methyl-accepting chemotaxis protein [Rhodospirillaceae bacterium]|nr:methyl-accepting chemotaxis protein [Rhodospirillaceae bacterium]
MTTVDSAGLAVDSAFWTGKAGISRPSTMASRRLSGGWRQLRAWWQDGDIPWFRDLSVQRRFNLLIGLALIAGILVGGVYAVAERRISASIVEQGEFQRIGEITAEIRVGALALQADASGLIDERKGVFIDGFAGHLATTKAALAEIRKMSAAASHAADIDDMDRDLDAVAAKFAALTDRTLTLGLSETEGLRGQLGASVGAIESELAMWPNTDDLKTRLLRMRQAEKDFMLYQDNSFLGRHRKYAAEFDLGIDVATLAPSTREQFRGIAGKYAADMALYGKAYLGQQAALAELRSQFSQLQPRINAFAAAARRGLDDATGRQAATRIQMGRVTAVVSGLALLMFVVIGVISGRSIARPVLAMERVMHRLAKGENTVEIPGTRRADEIGLMAKAVQVFRDNAVATEALRAAQAAEQAARESRGRRLEAMIGRFDEDVGSVIKAVASSAGTSEMSAREMASFVNETLSHMRSVDDSSGQATANVQSMAAAAEQLAFSVSEISARVNDATRLADEATGAAQQTREVIHGLFDVTQRVDTVISFIQNIARRTRLLALNASIEAMLAGEHGHGFKVVANEVKQLADQTGKATEEISSQILAVQAVGREAAGALEKIAKVVSQVNEVAGTIAGSVEEQGAATREIAHAAQEAAQNTAVVASSISWVVNEASQMKAAAGEVLDSSGILARKSEALRVVVDDFLLGLQDGDATPLRAAL